MALVFSQHECSQIDSAFMGTSIYGGRSSINFLPRIRLAEMSGSEDMWRQPPAEVNSPSYPYGDQHVTPLVENSPSPLQAVPFGGFQGRSGGNEADSAVPAVEHSLPKHWIDARMKRCGTNEPIQTGVQEEALTPRGVGALKNPSLPVEVRSPQHWMDARISSPNRRGQAHVAGSPSGLRRSKSCETLTENGTVPSAECSASSSPSPQSHSWWKLRSRESRSTSGGRSNVEAEAEVAKPRPAPIPMSLEGMLFFSEISRSSILCPQAAAAAPSWHAEVPCDDLSGLHVKPPPRPVTASAISGEPSLPSRISKLSPSLGRPTMNLIPKDLHMGQLRRSTQAASEVPVLAENSVEAKLHPLADKLPQLI